MTPPEAKRIVLGSVAVAGALAATSQLTAGHAPRLRIFIGACMAGAILAMGAEVAPTAAAMLGLTMALSALFLVGPDTWRRLASFVS